MRVIRGASGQSAEPTVLTIGNFDGVHLGHRALLSRVCSHATRLGLSPAVLTFEPLPREFFTPEKAPPRLSSLREKLELIAEDGIQTALVYRFDAHFARLSAETFIETILLDQMRVRYLVVGDDFCFGANRSGDLNLLKTFGERHGFTVETLSPVLFDGERISSSRVRAALADGDMDKAADLLGRPYIIDGLVVTGRRLGHTLGFPTANMRIKHNPPPFSGVFAVEVSGLGDQPHFGVANLGMRPTLADASVAGRLEPLLEVHLFDFARQIYGAHLSVRFRHKLRNEQKFSGLAELKSQIERDAIAARAYFGTHGSLSGNGDVL